MYDTKTNKMLIFTVRVHAVVNLGVVLTKDQISSYDLNKQAWNRAEDSAQEFQFKKEGSENVI